MLSKIVNSYIIEVKLMLRTIWTWIFLLLALINVGILFVSRLEMFDPGGALISTAFIIQGGIFVSMILGFSLIKEEAVCSADELFNLLPDGYISKIGAKCLALLTAITFFIILTIAILYYLFWFYGVPLIYYWQALPYLFLYWGTSFWISGIIGMLAGVFFKTRMVYPLLILIWLLIGPLNMAVFKVLMSISQVDLNPIANFMNLGQSDPYTTYDPVYGLPLEIHRWLQKGLWVITISGLFFMAVIYKNNNRSRHLIIKAVAVYIIIGMPLIYLFTREEQVIRTYYETNAVRKYDLNYYRVHTKPSFENLDSFKIESYDISLISFRNLKAQVKMKVKILETTDKLVFTLYHNLRVKRVIDDNNKDLSYKQQGDQVLVSFTAPLHPEMKTTIIFDYEGTSSPYFYANEQALMLPAYFPWLPMIGSHQAMMPQGGDVIRFPLYSQNLTTYTLRYSGPEPVCTNLPQKEPNLWSGTVSQGVSLAAGMLTEIKLGKTSVYYPISLCRIIEELPGYIDRLQEIAQSIKTDLAVQKTLDTSKIFFLSVPRESRFVNTTILNQGDHLIIGISRMYNKGNLYKNDISIVPAVLSSLIKSDNITNQKDEIRELFEAGYAYWYGTRFVLPDLDRPTLLRIIEAYKFLRQYKDAEMAKELLTFIEENKTNQDLLQSFFREWLNKLQTERLMSGDDLFELIKAKGGEK